MSPSLLSRLAGTGLCGVLALAPLAAPASAAPINDKFKSNVASFVSEHIDDWVAVYKDFHAHPELGLEETRSAGIIAEELRTLGFEVTEGIGQTGVVGILRDGKGPLVMVRADMDALPLQEKTGLDYASTVQTEWRGENTYVMHACGHDAHMAIFLATAQTLVDMKKDWKGTLMFVAQPAEEGGGGASKMMADDIFGKFGVPDYGFALHVGPSAYDTVQIVKGQMNSFAGGFDIVFNGIGGHGSRPSTTIDPIMMASKFVVDLQSVVSREKPEQEFGVISVGAIQAGSAGNIIPDSARVRGTVRWYKPAVGEKLLAGVKRTAEAIVAMAGAPDAEISVRSGGTAVFNDPDLSEKTLAAMSKVLPADKVYFAAPTTGSEDYGEFLKAFSNSVYFRVGVYDPALFDETGAPLDVLKVPGNHSPYFAPVPAPTIETGVTAMTTAVVNVMAK
ncbi:MAG: amidohydrolase [Alphaproteobacteria bacterium]|nr:amidohydrolase [Alphaproteobacteria bacterium]MBU2084233.1 amidohydrolase [Alphaproteobacteria bacterium]MBU2197309.1 amidohydrolase [Alphaproteobacteria bacterium]